MNPHDVAHLIYLARDLRRGCSCNRDLPRGQSTCERCQAVKAVRDIADKLGRDLDAMIDGKADA